MNSDRDLDRARIVDALSATLSKRRDTLDTLADAAIALDRARAAFADAYKSALAAGWTTKELTSAGVAAPDKPTRRRRPAPRTQPNTNHTPADTAEHE